MIKISLFLNEYVFHWEVFIVLIVLLVCLCKSARPRKEEPPASKNDMKGINTKTNSIESSDEKSKTPHVNIV